MNDLIDRYVWAIAKDLPGDTRDDVARELRATIEDMVEARGPESDATVREVLVELGDPAELALRYRGKRRYLIGPAVYPLYTRLLRILLLVIVPVVFAATLIERLRAAEEHVLTDIFGAVNAGLLTGVMVTFWTTIVFVILERAGVGQDESSSRDDGAWDPDSLPPAFEKRQITLADTIFSLVALSLLVVLVLWLRSHSVVQLFTGRQWMDADGGSVPFLDEGLWDFWMPALVAVIAVGMAVEVWKYLSGRWTPPLVITNVLVDVLVAGVVAAILTTQRVIDPVFLAEFRERTGAEFPGTVVGLSILGVVIGICLWDSIHCVVKYLRVRRAAGLDRTAADVA